MIPIRIPFQSCTWLHLLRLGCCFHHHPQRSLILHRYIQQLLYCFGSELPAHHVFLAQPENKIKIWSKLNRNKIFKLPDKKWYIWQLLYCFGFKQPAYHSTAWKEKVSGQKISIQFKFYMFIYSEMNTKIWRNLQISSLKILSYFCGLLRIYKLKGTMIFFWNFL